MGNQAEKTEKVLKTSLHVVNSVKIVDKRQRHNLTKKEVNEFFQDYNSTHPDAAQLAKKMFDAIDDGAHFNDFLDLYLSLRESKVDNFDEIQKNIYKSFDLNNDGFLKFDEFLTGYVLTSKGDHRAKLDYAFQLYDDDNNGWLSQKELRRGINSMMNLYGGDMKTANDLMNEISKIIDSDGNGKISKGINNSQSFLVSYNLYIMLFSE
jgi:Ca2+-binding EF-hand superfamily protein